MEQASEGTALLHSGVFHPRLTGGMDTIFWQKLIRPMTQPDAPAFFLLDESVPWQRQVLGCLHDSWKEVSDEPFDYENRVRYHLSLALRLLSTQCVGGRTKVSQQEQIASERMKQMLRLVEEHYSEELTVQLIADSVALSESACLRSFRQMLGITPIQYVKQYRVEKAAELLRSTRLKTGEIGAECGFTDSICPMQRTLTSGPITSSILLFALPLMFGNLLQQMYNIADTWVVGRFLSADALAAVGSSYTLMTFLTSILLGLCMGSGAAISMQYGSGESEKIQKNIFKKFILIAGIALVLNLLVYLGLDGILWVLRVPEELTPLMKDYLLIVFLGITATFLYNYFANLLRAIGNSVVPLVFLAVSAILNVFLDLFCVIVLGCGIKGAAGATVFSQFVSGVGIGVYTLKKFPELCPRREDCRWDKQNLAAILNLSVMTSVQQSIMNFGILMVQGLVNSFGTVIMAAFAAAVKIDSFAYMPVQDFGNAFSTYVAQNYGAGQTDRIRRGIRSAGLTSALFCIFISVMVCLFAAPLMGIFIDPSQADIIAAGVHYLRIEGACYIGIGLLFLLYGYYRAVNQPGMSVVLTIASLGTRVALAYLLSATPLGVTGIWLSVPIGWALADVIGIGYYLVKHRKVTQ